MTAVAATSMTHLARAGLGVGQVGHGQDFGASGLGGDDGSHGASLGRAASRTAVGSASNSSVLWSTELSSGISSSTSSGSGASAGRSQPSASAWARAASSRSAPGRRPGAPAATPEEVRRDRRGRPLHLVGGDPGQVEDQRLVDLGLDLEHVAQLVDPVVKVHRSRFPTPNARAATPDSRHPGHVSRRSRRSAHVSTSRASPPSAGDLGQVERREQAVQRQAVTASGGPHPVERRQRRAPRPAGAARPASARNAPSWPSAAAEEPGDRPGADPRHVHSEHQEQVRRGQPGRRGRRAGPRPVRRAAGPRGRRSTGREVGTCSPTTTTSAASATAARACSSSVRPAYSTPALSTPSEPGGGAAGEHDRGVRRAGHPGSLAPGRGTRSREDVAGWAA